MGYIGIILEYAQCHILSTIIYLRRTISFKSAKMLQASRAVNGFRKLSMWKNALLGKVWGPNSKIFTWLDAGSTGIKGDEY